MSEPASVVITGVSSGIGYSTAKVLAARGFQVFAGVRKQADADRLARDLSPLVTPILLDVTDEASIHAAAALVATHLGNRTLFGLVNNAGVAGGGPLLHQPLAEFRQTLEVNLVGPFLVTQAFGPLLGADRARTGPPGRIIQISSVGGRFGAPFLGSYVASKFALEGMSESLRRELLLFGIDVIVIGPGSVITPIFEKADHIDISQYDRTEYGPILRGFLQYFRTESKRGLAPERIGELVLKTLTTRSPKTRYAIVPQRFKNWTVPMSLPKRLVDRMIGKQSGLLKARP